MPTLLDMTDVPMTNILEQCDFHSLMTLRQVCKSLREFISDSHLKTELSHVYIHISLAVIYFLSPTKPRSIIDEENPSELLEKPTLNELRTILSIQSSKLDTFEIWIPWKAEYFDDLVAILKAKRRPIQAEKFVMQAWEVHDFMQVLPCLDSEVLKTIHLSCDWKRRTSENIEDVLETEQLKNAEVFKLSGFTLGRTRNVLCKLFHLQECDVWFLSISENDLIDLIMTFTTSTHMRSFTLQPHSIGNYTYNKPELLEKLFGSPSWNSTWYFEMKKCEEHVLEMKFQKETKKQKNKLYLRKVEKSEVSDKAIIIRT